MATLHDTFTILREHASYELGFTMSSVPDSATTKGKLIDYCIKQGLRRVYWPMPIASPSGPIVVRWTFLSIWSSVTMYDDYTTGTIEVTNGSKVVTLSGTDAEWPSWVNADITTITVIASDGTRTECTVHARTDDNNLELASNWSGTSEDGLSYILNAGPYELPTDFASMETALLSDYPTAAPLIKRDSADVRLAKIQWGNCGVPRFYSVEAQAHAGASTQVCLLRVWPTVASTLQIRYRVSPAMLDAGSPAVAYAYGGPYIHELIMESVLSVCEERKNRRKGVHWENFVSMLPAAVLADAENEPDYFGHMTQNNSGGVRVPAMHSNEFEGSTVTYTPG